MNAVLFNRWLFESESDSLDFKRDQYKFIRASNKEKSELIKDILAMVNSWRRVDGYIVIGIEEKPEKPNILHGITKHIDDAKIQQFVNSKVNGICNLEYKTYTKDGNTFGIIRIPVQKRPLYLTKDFGDLKANTVYVRRGTSTSIANIDEISKMGADQYEFSTQPSLEVGFFDRVKGSLQGVEMGVDTRYIFIKDEIPDYYTTNNENNYIYSPGPNRDYYRDLIAYINFKSSFIPVHFALENTGEREAVNLRTEFEFFSNDIEILLDGEEVDEPDPSYLHNIRSVYSVRQSAYSAVRLEDKWIISNGLDRLHAQRMLGLNGTIYLQAKESTIIKGKATVYFDGQTIPYEQEYEIRINCNRIDLDWDAFFIKLSKNE